MNAEIVATALGGRSAVVEGLLAEHGPHGPTEEHLVEEIAGIMWRKRRLRLAEAAAHRRGLEGTLAAYRQTVKVALVHLDTTGQSERVADAIRTTAGDTEEDMADMAEDEVMTRRALDLLGSKRNDAYEAALAALREDTQAWWADVLARDPVGVRHRRCRASLPRRRGAAVVREPEEGTGQPASDPRAGVRRGARPRQAGADWSLRGASRPQARTNAHHATAAQGTATCCRRGLIRLAKAKPDARVLPSQDCMREGEARRSATGRAVFRVNTQATNVAGPGESMAAFGWELRRHERHEFTLRQNA